MNRIILCTIQGISPILMHRFPLVKSETEEKMLSPEERAEIAAYRDPDTGRLYIPGIAVQRALVNGATYSKGKGRASLQKQVAACVLVNPERCDLGTDQYIIDIRSVVIPATKGRVLSYRPRLNEWRITFEIEFDPNLLREEEIRKIVDDTGSRVGLLDFRPEKKGPFGRFMVVEWRS